MCLCSLLSRRGGGRTRESRAAERKERVEALASSRMEQRSCDLRGAVCDAPSHVPRARAGVCVRVLLDHAPRVPSAGNEIEPGQNSCSCSGIHVANSRHEHREERLANLRRAGR